MSKEIILDLTKNYKATLRDLKEKLVEVLGDKLDCLILYGSVAREDFRPESDIDILIIVEDKKSGERAYSLGYDIDIQNGTVTSILPYSPEDIEQRIKQGSPFIENVMEEGKVIYDNGTWARLHRGVVRAS